MEEIKDLLRQVIENQEELQDNEALSGKGRTLPNPPEFMLRDLEEL